MNSRRASLDQGDPLAKRRQNAIAWRVVGRWRPGKKRNRRHTEPLGHGGGFSQQALMLAVYAIERADSQYRRLPVFWQCENILHAWRPLLPSIPTIYYHGGSAQRPLAAESARESGGGESRFLSSLSVLY